MNPVLQVNNLCRDQILHEISFEMEAGEMLAIMGPSGSGKSTLLYNAAGLDTPDGGSVRLNNKELSALNEEERAKLRLTKIGFVFQQRNPAPGLSLEENSALPGIQAQSRRGKKQVYQKARALMKQLGLEGMEKRQVSQISGGQLQRACICRSLINEPLILFAYEPTGALNRQASKEVMDELVKLNRRGMSILMVTHDSKTAACCDRILYLQDGQIQDELSLRREDMQREANVNNWLARHGW